MPDIQRRLLIITILALTSICLSLGIGSTPAFYTEFQTIFLQLRLPRTLSGFTAGGMLALAGAFMQLLLRNPLADPYILGVSSGAAFFSLLLMLLGAGGNLILTGSWVGSLVTAMLVISLAAHYRWQIHHLIIIGMATAGTFASGISLILLLAPAASVHGMLFWLMGDLNDAQLSISSLFIFAGSLLVGWILAPALNILGRGELEAESLGIPVKRYRFFIFALASLLTATAVTEAGCLSFVGLIVPHFARRLFGYQHRYTLPATALLGGTLVVIADTLARSLFAPMQIPVGILLTLTGVPIFISLLKT